MLCVRRGEGDREQGCPPPPASTCPCEATDSTILCMPREPDKLFETSIIAIQRAAPPLFSGQISTHTRHTHSTHMPLSSHSHRRPHPPIYLSLCVNGKQGFRASGCWKSRQRVLATREAVHTVSLDRDRMHRLSASTLESKAAPNRERARESEKRESKTLGHTKELLPAWLHVSTCLLDGRPLSLADMMTERKHRKQDHFRPASLETDSANLAKCVGVLLWTI